MTVYFMCDADSIDPFCVKIGKSKNHERRRRELQTGAHYRLALVGWIQSDDDKALEKSQHDEYKHRHMQGEWFALDVETVLKELSSHAALAHVAKQKSAGRVLGRDRDGIPEYESVGEWGRSST